MQRIVDQYPKSSHPRGFEGGELNEEVIRERLLFMIQHKIPNKSKPGIPYQDLGTNNGDILPENCELIISETIKRLHVLSTPHEELSKLGPAELVRINAVGLVKQFTKNEPHSNRKVREQRWRGISAINIVDQLVERLLCSAQNRAEINNWSTIPSAPGVGLSDDEQLKTLKERFERLQALTGFAAEADVTGWDWSVQGWELMAEAEMRISLGSFNDFTANILRNRYHCVANSVYMFPNGQMVCLPFSGVQLSGCYNTSSTNSRLRVLVAYLVGALWAVAMGDDCVEDPVPDAEEKYKLYGHPLKMYNVKRTGEPVEFCSLTMAHPIPHPCDGTKTLYRLLEQKKITPELVAQFRMEMRHSPRRDEFLQSVERTILRSTEGASSLAGGQ